MALINQDLSGVTDEDLSNEGGGGWEAMPEGWYRFMITDTDYKMNSKGTGKTLHLTFNCVEPGEYAKERKMEFLSVDHPNGDTRRIAQAHLKQIAVAVDYPNPDFVKQSKDLHGVPMWCRLSVEPEENAKYSDRNGMRNRMTAYRHLNDPPDEKIHEGNMAREVAVDEGPPVGAPPPDIDDDSVPF